MHSTDEMEDGYLGSGKLLRYSIRKYGKENHFREVIELVFDRQALCLLEAKIIDKHQLKDPDCMNLVTGGGSGDVTIEKAAKARLGQKLTDEHKRKISQSMKGVIHSEDACRKMSESKRGKQTWALGQKFSEEHKRKMRDGNRGQKRTEESRQKMRDAWKKRVNRGQKHTEETKRKLSEKARLREERKRQIVMVAPAKIRTWVPQISSSGCHPRPGRETGRVAGCQGLGEPA